MKSLVFQLLIGSILLAFISCKGDTTAATEKVVIPEYTYKGTSEAYKNNPTRETGSQFITEITKRLSDPSLTVMSKRMLLEEGIKVCTEQNFPSRNGSFLFPYVKDNINAPTVVNKIYQLAFILKDLKKEAAANTLFQGLVDKYPDHPDMETIKASITTPISSINAYIQKLGEDIFVDPDVTGVNRKASLAYVDACEAFAVVYQDNQMTPEYLFKAAEVAKSIKTFPKSLSLYDWIIDKYPNYEKAATALFLKGFIIENNLGNDSLALATYKKFIQTHPTHDLADDAEFLIQNIGKTDEQILEMIEQKRLANEKNGQ